MKYDSLRLFTSVITLVLFVLTYIFQNSAPYLAMILHYTGWGFLILYIIINILESVQMYKG